MNRDDFKFENGVVQLPSKLGLGVEVNKDLVLQENELFEQSKMAYEKDKLQPDPEWKNPVWRHADGSIAEW